MTGSCLFGASLIAAFALIFVPALFATPEDAARIGYFGEDYEGNLCGQLGFDPDGRMGRDLRQRPFAYWLNASSIICVRTCPHLADELLCEYPLESLENGAKRAALGARCFAQWRTRTAFPACLPHAPAAALPVDRWLASHAIDQLAADTLHASAVLLGCWVAAGLASLVCLGGLLFAPRLTVLLTMIGALTTALAAASMLLPHGVRTLAAARAPLDRNEATYWREELPGALQFALGWAAVAGVALLVLTLCSRVRRAPLAAALFATPTRPLLAMPSLLLLPLYLFVAVGTPLCSWVTAIVYLAAPYGAAEGCGLGASAARLLWPLSLMAPYWLASAVTSWVYCTVGGAVGRWYASLAPPAGADAPKGATAASSAAAAASTVPPPPSWPLWRSGWLAIDAHFSSIGTAAVLLPFATIVRIVVPPVASPPRRSVDPYSRFCLGLIQRALRCCLALPRSVHPGGLIYLARQPPIGLPTAAQWLAEQRGVAAAEAAAERQQRTALRRPAPYGDFVGGGSPNLYYDDAADAEATLGDDAGAATGVATGFLEAGERCARLFDSPAGAHLAAAREAAHYFYSLLKWTIAGGVAFVGWLCLTSSDAQPLMSPIWPTAIILEGSLALASAALAVHEAALEALLQAYADELATSPASAAAAPAAATPVATAKEFSFYDEAAAVGTTPRVTAERAAAAASLFGSADAAAAGGGYGSMSSGAPYSTIGSFSGGGRAPAPEADELGDEHLQVPPSYDTLPLSAAALAAA